MGEARRSMFARLASCGEARRAMFAQLAACGKARRAMFARRGPMGEERRSTIATHDSLGACQRSVARTTLARMRLSAFRVAARALEVAALLSVAASCGGSPAHPATPGEGTGSDPTQALIPAGSAGSQKAERMTNPSYSSCHSSYKMATQNVGVEVVGMAQGCAAVTRMHPLGTPFQANQSAANAPQSFPVKAQANHCYRVYGAAVVGIKDLDLVLKDSTGAIAGEDSTDDPTPVVLEDGVVCFKENDDASVVASVGDGSGAFALQVWSD